MKLYYCKKYFFFKQFDLKFKVRKIKRDFFIDLNIFIFKLISKKIKL